MKTTDLFTLESVPGVALAAVLALIGAGCGGGSTTATPNLAVNAPPTLAFQTPIADQEGPVGMGVSITYVANDPDDTAMTHLFADRDGDLATTGDQFAIVQNRPEANGAVIGANWDTGSAPEGLYHLIGVVDDGANAPRVVDCSQKVQIWNAYPHDHSNIVMMDRYGDALRFDSTEPYSPRETCGKCHDIDEMANGYHFQQGRTDEHGAIQTKNDFFADGRKWLQSDGMYGKW